MVKTIDAVRADAGHLLLSLHTDNPFSQDSRAQFIAALSSLDIRLGGGIVEQAAETIRALEIEPPEHTASELQEARDLIDELDKEIVDLLIRRTELAHRAK